MISIEKYFYKKYVYKCELAPKHMEDICVGVNCRHAQGNPLMLKGQLHLQAIIC